MEKKLHLLGLSEVEARVYLALYKFPQAMVQTIAREAGIPRTTCYGILAKLLSMGYVSEKMQNNTKYYASVPIDVLFERLKRDFTDLQNTVPDIKSLKGFYLNQPKVSFFKGIESVKNLYEDTLTADGEILGYVNPQYTLQSFYTYQYEDYIPRRIAKNIKFRGLYIKNDFSLEVKKRSKELLKEIHFLPTEKFSIHHETNIYNDKITYIFFKEREIYGAMIQDEDLVKTEKSIFEMLWEYTKA